MNCSLSSDRHRKSFRASKLVSISRLQPLFTPARSDDRFDPCISSNLEYIRLFVREGDLSFLVEAGLEAVIQESSDN